MRVDLGFPDVVRGTPVQRGGGMNLPTLLPLLGQELENNTSGSLSSVDWMGVEGVLPLCSSSPPGVPNHLNFFLPLLRVLQGHFQSL